MMKVDISTSKDFPLWRELKEDSILVVCDDVNCDMYDDKCEECIFNSHKMTSIWELEEKRRILKNK